MKIEDALLWYGQGRFTADDVTRATGLSERSQRELLKLGILQPVPQAKTKARLLGSHMLKRAAVIAPLNRAGLSLGVAGRIAYAAMTLEDLVFDIVDPWDVLFDPRMNIDPATGLPQLRNVPNNRDKWFDPAHPPAVAEADFYLAIVNSRFVMLGVNNPDAAFGELTPDLSEFVWWKSGMFNIIRDRIHDNEVSVSVNGWDDHADSSFGSFNITDDPKIITFKVKSETEEDNRSSEDAKNNPVSILTINASLALRVALRRLLYIDKSR